MTIQSIAITGGQFFSYCIGVPLVSYSTSLPSLARSTHRGSCTPFRPVVTVGAYSLLSVWFPPSYRPLLFTCASILASTRALIVFTYKTFSRSQPS